MSQRIRVEKFASYPQEMASADFTHDRQWPWLRYPATLTRRSFANHISTKAFFVILAAAHMCLNRSKPHDTRELSVPSQMRH